MPLRGRDGGSSPPTSTTPLTCGFVARGWTAYEHCNRIGDSMPAATSWPDSGPADDSETRDSSATLTAA
jgi:hypothetical protein